MEVTLAASQFLFLICFCLLHSLYLIFLFCLLCYYTTSINQHSFFYFLICFGDGAPCFVYPVSEIFYQTLYIPPRPPLHRLPVLSHAMSSRTPLRPVDSGLDDTATCRQERDSQVGKSAVPSSTDIHGDREWPVRDYFTCSVGVTETLEIAAPAGYCPTTQAATEITATHRVCIRRGEADR